MTPAALWTKFRQKVEARWFLFGSHFTLVITGFLFYRLQRGAFQISVGVIAAIATELLCAYFLGRFVEFKFWDRILSALSIVFGLLVLLHSAQPYFYAIAAVVAVLSKYLIRRPDGKHIYNPTNFAIIFCVAILPVSHILVYPDEFSRKLLPYISVTTFGILATALSRRWVVSASYLLGNLVISAIMAPVVGVPFGMLFGPEIGLLGLIFLFLMITDPQTTPRTYRGMIAFGLSVAAVNHVLRYFEYTYSYFIALFLVVTGYQLFWIVPMLKSVKAEAAARPLQT